MELMNITPEEMDKLLNDLKNCNEQYKHSVDAIYRIIDLLYCGFLDEGETTTAKKYKDIKETLRMFHDLNVEQINILEMAIKLSKPNGEFLKAVKQSKAFE